MSRIETLLTVAVLDTNTAMKDTNMERTKYETWRDLRRTQGELAYHLDVFGDHLATREGYKGHEGHEALQFYLIQKYHWLPSDVRGLSWEDLRFIFKEEMADWTLPDEAVFESKD